MEAHSAFRTRGLQEHDGREAALSIEQARLFIERVNTDDAFRLKVLAERDVDARMDLIRSEGFDCTAEEIAGVLVAMAGAAFAGAVGRGAAPAERRPEAGGMWDTYRPN